MFPFIRYVQWEISMIMILLFHFWLCCWDMLACNFVILSHVFLPSSNMKRSNSSCLMQFWLQKGIALVQYLFVVQWPCRIVCSLIEYAPKTRGLSWKLKVQGNYVKETLGALVWLSLYTLQPPASAYLAEWRMHGNCTWKFLDPGDAGDELTPGEVEGACMGDVLGFAGEGVVETSLQVGYPLHSFSKTLLHFKLLKTVQK